MRWTKNDLPWKVQLPGSGHSSPVLWGERLFVTSYGSPVCVGEHLYGINRNGDVVVLAAAKPFALLARNALGEGSHGTPAVAHGRLYLRTFSHLIAVGSKEPTQGPRRSQVRAARHGRENTLHRGRA